jgi:cytoskeleton protein RodZ
VDAGDTVTEQEPGPGRRLREERERLGITVREVAEHLNLTAAVVHAIEADDYSRLPGPVFVRGYLRAYARLLQLDPQPLLARCPYGTEDAGPAPQPAGPSLREWIRHRPALVLGGGAVLAVAALTGVLLAVWPHGEPDIEPIGLEARAAAADTRAGEPSPRAEGPAFEPDPAAPTDLLSQSDAEPVRDSVPGTPAQAAGPDGEPAGEVVRIGPDGQDRIELTFSEDCWVEIRDAAGVSRYSGLSRAGSELVLEGDGPLRVLLGYAPGATLAFNGEPVPLQPHTRNNVASLVLGQ